MKTYHSSTKEKKKGLLKKHLYAIIIGVSILVIGGTVALSLILANRNKSVDTGVPPVLQEVYQMPVDEFNIGMLASLECPVWSNSLGYYETHNGVDFTVKKDAVVKSISKGKVTGIENSLLEGWVVTVTHANGIASIYKGLNKEISVKVGDDIAVGAKLGTVAEVMDYESSEGTHLHLEMTKDGNRVDPMVYLGEGDK